MPTDEIWVTLGNFPNYQVSNLGRVRNVTTGKMKKPTVATTGHLVVNLSGNGKSHVRKVHSLVAEAFMGQRDPSLMVRHKDGDNYNCRAENLTYAPIAAAISKNSRKAGRYLTGKLNSQLAEDIRERSTRGEAVGQLAQEYGVSTSLISNIKHGKKWREQPASAEVPLEATLATILDVDDERRAGVAARLAPFFGQVDDVADVDSLLSNWPNDRYLVVCDEGAAIQKIQQAMRSTVDCRPHIVYAESPPLAAIVDAVSGGAADYLAWPCSQAYLGARVQAWPRRAAFSRRIHGTVSAALRKISSLSARERQVLRLVVLGRTSAEIGQQLAISGRTVEVHRNSVLRKLDVQSSTAAAKIAAEAGW